MLRHLKLKMDIKIKVKKLLSFRIDDEKLFEKCKAIWIKIEHLKKIDLNALPFHDEGYMKTKIRTQCHNVDASCPGLNVPDVDKECESFTVISIDYLLAYENKHHLPANKLQIILMRIFLNIRQYKYCILSYRIDISDGIDPVNSNRGKECMICHYWFFNCGFKF